MYLVLVGITQGLVATAGGAVWAERYGVLHLGAIRSMAQAVMVLSTAIAPVLLGILLDLGVGLNALAMGIAAAMAMVSLLACVPLLLESQKGGEGSYELKQDCGAEYVVAQFCYDNRDFYDFVQRCRSKGITIPIRDRLCHPAVRRPAPELGAEAALLHHEQIQFRGCRPGQPAPAGAALAGC